MCLYLRSRSLEKHFCATMMCCLDNRRLSVRKRRAASVTFIQQTKWWPNVIYLCTWRDVISVSMKSPIAIFSSLPVCCCRFYLRHHNFLFLLSCFGDKNLLAENQKCALSPFRLKIFGGGKFGAYLVWSLKWNITNQRLNITVGNHFTAHIHLESNFPSSAACRV